MKIFLLILVVFTFLLSPFVYPVTPSSGLPGIAVSPDGKTIALGGISRVIYILDAKTFKVIKRIWVKTQVLNLAFNKTGSTLVSENRDATLNFINMADYSLIKSYDKVAGLTVSPISNEAIVHTYRAKPYSINVYSMTEGTLLRSIPVDKKIQLCGIDADGKRLIVLTRSEKKIEKKIPRNMIPKNLKGIEREEFIQKNDGKVSEIIEFNPKSGKLISRSTIFFTNSQYAKMAVTSKAVYIFNYGNVNANISKDGKVKIFRPANQYNYGIGISTDNKTIAGGGLRNGSIYDIKSEKTIKFKISSIPGWPEYFKGFAFAKDGKFYAGTSAFRIIEFDSSGKKLRAVPIY